MFSFFREKVLVSSPNTIAWYKQQNKFTVPKNVRPVLFDFLCLLAMYLITNHSYGQSDYLCCGLIYCQLNSSQRARCTQRIGGASAALQAAANTSHAKDRRAERGKEKRKRIQRKVCCLRKQIYELTIKYIRRASNTGNMSRSPGRKQENHKIVRHFCNVLLKFCME